MDDRERLERWIATLFRRYPAQPALVAYREARELTRLQQQPRPPAGFREDPAISARIREVLRAAEDDTTDLKLSPLLKLVATIGAPALARYAARRIVPMLNLIPVPIRPYVISLVSAALALGGWSLGLDLQGVAAILGAGSAAQMASVRARLAQLGASGWKTWTVLGLQALVNIGMIVATLTGNAAVGVAAAGLVNQVIELLSASTTSQALEKVVAQPAATLAANVKEVKAEEKKAEGGFASWSLLALLGAMALGFALATYPGCSPKEETPPPCITWNPATTPPQCQECRSEPDGSTTFHGSFIGKDDPRYAACEVQAKPAEQPSPAE